MPAKGIHRMEMQACSLLHFLPPSPKSPFYCLTRSGLASYLCGELMQGPKASVQETLSYETAELEDSVGIRCSGEPKKTKFLNSSVFNKCLKQAQLGWKYWHGGIQ